MKKNYSGEFKALVAIQAIIGYYTVSELSYKFEVQKEQVVEWKRQALDGLPYLMEGNPVTKNDDQKKIIEGLWRLIVTLREENDRLKKLQMQKKQAEKRVII